MVRTRAEEMAASSAPSMATSCCVPRYDSIVRFASGVVSTITVPARAKNSLIKTSARRHRKAIKLCGLQHTRMVGAAAVWTTQVNFAARSTQDGENNAADAIRCRRRGRYWVTVRPMLQQCKLASSTPVQLCGSGWEMMLTPASWSCAE